MIKKVFVSLLCCVLIVCASMVLVRATSVLTLTVSSDSNLYDRYTTVTLHGGMDYYDYIAHQYPSDGLVGVEIIDSAGAPMVIRTVRTGNSNPNSITANIASAYLCNQGGAEQSSIPLPTATNQAQPYYYVDVVNNNGTTIPMLVTMNVYDSNGVPIALTSQMIYPGPYSDGTVLNNFNIPSWAHYGTATAYVDVYSDWPANGGVPYGFETTFQFTITGGTPFTGTPTTTQGASGNYSLTFRIPKTAALGTYTVYTGADYLGIYGSASTTFQVAQLGDLNGDGAVTFVDIQIFVADYLAYYSPSHTYTAAIDFTHSGVINFNDVQLMVHYYLIYWSS